jgi:hypothetical protein
MHLMFLEKKRTSQAKLSFLRGWGHGGEMIQALYAHMNNKTIIKKKTKKSLVS